MIEQGNLMQKAASQPQTYWWIMGSFIDKNSIFHSDKVEVKFTIHKQWEIYQGSTSDFFRKTLCILISWKAEFHFWKHNQFLLEKPFDYIIDTEIPGDHQVIIIEDATLLVIRHF